jgi:hypothetical protein
LAGLHSRWRGNRPLQAGQGLCLTTSAQQGQQQTADLQRAQPSRRGQRLEKRRVTS